MTLKEMFIAYPAAMSFLSEKFNATSHELAAWLLLNCDGFGLKAYLNANELDSPPLFDYGYFACSDESYTEPLMACWFKLEDIKAFTPKDRYLTGEKLIARWSQLANIDAKAYIVAKIEESRLTDIHPFCGGTIGSYPEFESFPPVESGLFPLTEVEQIEREDFKYVNTTAQSNQSDRNLEWQKLANEEAINFKNEHKRSPTRNKIAKTLATRLGKTEGNIVRRIRKEW